jgi:Rad3-related DNA helicase
MSATINKTIISKETEIDEDTFEPIDQDSEIPKENRQIKFENTYWYKKEDDWNVVINKIKEIFDKHPDERGLIMCTSYYQITNILEKFEKNHHDDYTRLTKDKQGSKFKNTLSDNMKKSNGVIISAKAGTGIDLKDDASRFQIIIKAPFVTELADENNERAKRIQREDPERYFIKSMFKLVQFAGRSVRGNKDHAVTYVLDEPAQYMVKWSGKKKPDVPNWFYDACSFRFS